jgi:hypothetical protein
MKIPVDVTLSEVIEQSVKQDGLDATIQQIILWCCDTETDMDGIRKLRNEIEKFIKINE